MLRAAGVDIEAKNARVGWETYLQLYCMFEGGRVDLAKQAKFWPNFFDIARNGFCSEEVYMDLLEQMIRGINFESPTASTLLFAELY